MILRARIFIILYKILFLRKFLLAFFDWYKFYRQKIKVSRTGPNAIRNAFKDMRMLMGKSNISIVDGGANEGYYTMYFKMYFPDSKVYLFEPNKQIGLRENMKDFDDVYIYDIALGEKCGKVQFNIANNSLFSSILKTRVPDEKLKRKEIVIVSSLDSWAGDKKIDILKLDLEGYDLKALKGAKKLLKTSVKLIFIETCFNSEIYSNTLCELVNFLDGYDFKLFNLYGLDTNSSGVLMGVNALFVKK